MTEIILGIVAVSALLVLIHLVARWATARIMRPFTRILSSTMPCFGSNPTPAEQAEHDCRTCPLRRECAAECTSRKIISKWSPRV